MTRRLRRRAAASAAILAGALTLAGCVNLPESGPVVEVEVDDQLDEQGVTDKDARPPREGAEPVEVVAGFLDAMTAWPIQTNVATQYLSSDAAGEWDPEAATIVYSDYLPLSEDGTEVRVELTGANRLDASRGWRGPLSEGQRTMRFRLTVEDGEFRIANPGDALLVPQSWFQERFRQVSVYYFDPIADILVPEPIFVPVGEQLATNLVSALLLGPPPRLREVVRTFVPPGLSEGLSVPVSDSGVADLSLGGDAPRLSADQVVLLLAQLAWTLRQDPEITAFRLSIGGEEVPLPGGAAQYDLDSAAAYDPAGADSTGLLYGLSRGRLVVGGYNSLEPVEGPFGARARDLATAAVAPDAGRAAAVTGDGSSVLVAPVRATADGDRVATVFTGGTDLAQPAWDHANRLWLLDRDPGGAQVWSLEAGRTKAVRFPGVTGGVARHLLVSRDGTRLLALVQHPEGDRVVAARVVIDRRGRVDRLVSPRVIWTSGTSSRLVDIAWTGPTEVAILGPAASRGQFEVRTVPVDGAEVGVDTFTTLVEGRVRGLAGAPTGEVPVYAVLARQLVDVRTGERLALDARGVEALDYAG